MRNLFGRQADPDPYGPAEERPARRLLLPFFTLVFVIGLVGGLALAAWLIGPSDVDTTQQAPEPVPLSDAPTTAAGAAPKAVPAATADNDASPEASERARWQPRTVPPMPSWQEHGVATREPLDRPAVAVVIDDLGEQRRRSRAMAQLPGPLTLSYFPHTPALARLVGEAQRRGHEIMLHMPMASAKALNPGPKPLTAALDPASNRRRLAGALAAFPEPGPVAVNNHMGSAFTTNAHQMRGVLNALARRGVLFLDSLTAENSQARQLARRTGADVVARDIFLDHKRDPAAIRRALARTVRIAEKHGTAIAIGHPYPETRRALADWLPQAKERGLAIVSLSRVARLRLAGRQSELVRPSQQEARLSDG